MPPTRCRSTRVAAGVIAVTVVAVAAWLVTGAGSRRGDEVLPSRATQVGVAPQQAVPTGSVPALQGSPTSAAVPLVLRALESETQKPVAGATWRVGPHDGRSRFEGVTGPDGTSPLPAEALADWERHGLRAWGKDRRDATFRTPPTPKDGVVEILLDRFHVDHEGVVLDEAGRPVEGAQVAVVYSSPLDSGSWPQGDDVFRTTTDAQGRFRRSAKVWYPDSDVMNQHLLMVGGPGFVPVSRRLDVHGEKDLVVRLARDREHGTLEIVAIDAADAPAKGASVWVGATPTVADERTSPDGWVRRVFAEVWREADDPRGAGETWTWIGHERRPGWHHVLGADGRRTVHPLPPGPTRVQALGVGSADVTVEVLPPPAVTRLSLRLEPLRTVRGTVRVARDPAWPCRHASHEHEVAVDDWPERDWIRKFPTGRFSLSVPRSATRLRLSTWGRHPEAVVALAPAAGDEALELGVVEVPSARELSGVLVWPDGARAEPWSGLRLEDADGLVAATTTYWTSDGGPFFDFVTTRPPGPGARIVVRLRESDGEAGTVVRLEGPFDFESGRLAVSLPAGTPGRVAGE